MSSTAFYNFSTAGYILSLTIFAVHLLNTRKIILSLGIFTVAFSFLIQTWGMFLRWIEAGLLEVQAVEKAIGKALAGWSWFVVFTQHPPWSNLYEIMVYMSWGIVMVTLAAEMKWQIAWLRQIGIIFALMALGLAALTDASIKPLVPALKSWWIMIHVISASIAYAAGTIAAVICFFALMQDEARVSKHRFAGGALILMGLLLFSLAGGPHLFLEQAYFVRLLAKAGEGVVYALDMSKDNGVPFLIPIPGVGPIILLAVLMHVFLGFLLFIKGDAVFLKKRINLIFSASFTVVLAAFLLILFHDFAHTEITLKDSFSHHIMPPGPWFISFKSHLWSFGLLVFVVIMETLVCLFLAKPSVFRTKLPETAFLEGAAYKAISLSFFLMTLVLITGALWAHYAWGRYWAWDPKETGALAIWLNYAIYLHTRRTAGLAGPFSSMIGIVGFFVIIIGFLGVNLGLFADGLHTYGNS